MLGFEFSYIKYTCIKKRKRSLPFLVLANSFFFLEEFGFVAADPGACDAGAGGAGVGGSSALAGECRELELLIAALLLSPNFLYRSELGVSTTPDGTVYQLTPYEVATALSYGFLGTTPDEALLAKAQRNELQTEQQIGAEIEEVVLDAAQHRVGVAGGVQPRDAARRAAGGRTAGNPARCQAAARAEADHHLDVVAHPLRPNLSLPSLAI